MTDPAAAKVAQRRRELTWLVHSPALQADARNGDAEAKRVLEAARSELQALDERSVAA